MYISKKKQAIIDAFKTQKEKDDYINELKMEYNEKNRERMAKYYKENPEKVKEYVAKYYKENPEKVKEYVAKYRRENPEKVKEWDRKHRVKKKVENKKIKYAIQLI